jgi:mannose/fructose/N-acetylgalactosamine-specific phosphotransferase system component IID
MWWVYFNHETGMALEANRHLSFVWGYGNVFVASSAAAVGACLEAASEAGLHEEVSGRTVGVAVAVSVATFLVVTSYLHGRFSQDTLARVLPAASAAVILVAVGWLVGATSVPRAVLLQSLVVVAVVAVVVRRDRVSA